MSSVTYAAPARSFADRPRPIVVRRLGVIVLLALAAFAMLVLVDRGGAQARLEDQVAGHVVIEPGQSLWDVAVATAPDGIDPRLQLADLRQLNGLDGSHVEAWTVVLVPAR